MHSTFQPPTPANGDIVRTRNAAQYGARKMLFAVDGRGEEAAMGRAANDLKSDLEKSVAYLQTLRDDVRAKVRLAEGEARDRWKNLEPELETLELATHGASEAARAAATKAVNALKEFLASL